MHPANVFIDVVTGKPICIDCVIKFKHLTAWQQGDVFP